jgi:serine/threonine-protein kinase
VISIEETVSDEGVTDDSLMKAVAEAPAHPAAKARALVAGSHVGGFRIESRLGAGGMGVVYEAEDEKLRRRVALKVIGFGAEHATDARRRFMREARAAAAVNHPNVATVYEVGEADGEIYIAMELVVGTTLRAKLSEGGLTIDEVLETSRQIARGLARAHDRGVVHRDLKPENVMVGELVKVLDFGLARIDDNVSPEVASTATLQGEIAGTPGYMAPEQTTGGAVDARTDVFAFGVVLYEMLAGKRPFRGNTPMALAIAIARDAHAPLRTLRKDVPAALAAIVDRCLAKSPRDRFDNAGQILRALEAIDAIPVAQASAPDRFLARPRVFALGIVAVGLAIFAALKWRSDATPTASTSNFAGSSASIVDAPPPIAPSPMTATGASAPVPSVSMTASATAPSAAPSLRPLPSSPSSTAVARVRSSTEIRASAAPATPSASAAVWNER